MSTYQEYRYWSPVFGGEAVRLSMFDARGREFFMVLPVVESARAWREKRASCVEAIHTAIELKLQPGEVFKQ